MSYTAVATSRTPALVIYVLDVSGSMSDIDVVREDGSKARRIDTVLQNLENVATTMVSRSTRGPKISPRYRVAVFAYSGQVYDILGGVKTIEEFAQLGVPQLSTMDVTNTEQAFLEVERLLQSELPNLPEDSPAPLVCHMTDGEITAGGDPTPVAERIKAMTVPDGNVLVENIFIGSNLLRAPVGNIKAWSGLTSPSDLINSHAQRLFNMSSVIPDTYRALLHEMGYRGLQDNARMMFAGNDERLIELAFVMSGVTPTTAPPPIPPR